MKENELYGTVIASKHTLDTEEHSRMQESLARAAKKAIDILVNSVIKAADECTKK